MPTVESNVKGAALVMRLNNVARLFVGTGDKLLEQSPHYTGKLIQ